MITFTVKTIKEYEIEADTIEEALRMYHAGAWDTNPVHEEPVEISYINTNNDRICITTQ